MRPCVVALAMILGNPVIASAQEETAPDCEQLVMESVRARNALDQERWISLFVDDGELVRLATVKGRDALREFAARWSKDAIYQVTSVDIQPVDATTVTGHSLVTISWPSTTAGEAPQSIARGSALMLYLDKFELTGDGCKIVRREEIAVFQRESGDPVDAR